MLTLENFRLLNAKANSFEQGLGGKPDNTSDEVADLLSRVTKQCSMFARYQYALDGSLHNRLVDSLTDRMFIEDQKRKRPMFKDRANWRSIADMTLKAYKAGWWLTWTQKKRLTDVNRWTRRHEQAYQNLDGCLHDLDFELRNELHNWNQQQLEGYV